MPLRGRGLLKGKKTVNVFYICHCEGVIETKHFKKIGCDGILGKGYIILYDNINIL